MKGKIAFVLGAAVGYVLGTRAGRERYEQIKRGAQHVWNTEPVQQGVDFVKDSIGDRADELKVFVARVGADVFSGFAQPKQRTRRRSEPAGAAPADPVRDDEAGADAAAEAETESKPAAKRTAKGAGSGSSAKPRPSAKPKPSTSASAKTASAKRSGKAGS